MYIKFSRKKEQSVHVKSTFEIRTLRRGWWHFDATTAGAIFYIRYLSQEKDCVKSHVDF